MVAGGLFRRVAATAFLLAPLASAADDWLDPGHGTRRAARSQSVLRAYTAERETRAETALRRNARDAERRASARALRLGGTRRDAARAGTWLQIQDDQERLRTQSQLEELDRILRGGSALGPVTRRVLERGRLDLDLLERRAEAEAALRAP